MNTLLTREQRHEQEIRTRVAIKFWDDLLLTEFDIHSESDCKNMLSDMSIVDLQEKIYAVREIQSIRKNIIRKTDQDFSKNDCSSLKRWAQNWEKS